jgi:hypothetical protein
LTIRAAVFIVASMPRLDHAAFETGEFGRLRHDAAL